MGLPVEINPLFVSSTAGYTVGRSLRFRSSASAYLNRTPAAAGSLTTMTFSAWVKLSTFNAALNQWIWGAVDDNYGLVQSVTSNSLTLFFSGTTYVTTSAVFRDPSAWYHIVATIDTTNATSTNRLRLYVNGVLQTIGSSAYPAQNATGSLNSNVSHNIGRAANATRYWDGYLAEVNFIDGQALTPSSFGAYDTNGVWQPIKYTGTYGTNGFYLPFSNTTSTTTLVQDASGNGNNWTPNNISLTSGTTYDSMIDSPTNSSAAANYAVLNPLDKGAGITLSNANLTAYSNATNYITRSTIAVSSGKWYWEAVQTAQGSAATNNMINGIIPPTESTTNNLGYTAGSYGYVDTGNKVNNSVVTAYGATYGLNDIIGVALDLDGGTLTFYKNGVSQGTAFTGISGSFMFAIGDRGGGVSKEPTWAINFGQRPFSYTPPSGYNALNTANLPQPLISNGANYMAATLWTGNGTSQSIANSQSNGGNNALGSTFQPDFVWGKIRSGADYHVLANSIVGADKFLKSNTTDAETTNAQTITSFNSNGFSVGTSTDLNRNTYTFVGWQWKAGAGTTSTNTSGSITSTVSVNTTAGFSIVTYTGTGANATVGHGLGVAPSFIIVRSRNNGGATNWAVWHTSFSSTEYIFLNSTAAKSSSGGAALWNSTLPSSTVFSIGTDTNTNYNTTNMLAYCFAAVSGYSAFGSYTGNGSTDGPFTYLGFRPRYLLIKRTDTTSDWYIMDSSRSTYNLVTASLYADASSAEDTSSALFDFLSNGFKIRGSTNATMNASGGTYVYAAFCENPFNYSRAR